MAYEKTYDLIVAGAGVAGAAAALEAARGGLSVALVEKQAFMGGLATSGVVNVYLPLCDGCGRQVTFGIAEELLHLSYQYGPGAIPSNWRECVDGRAKARYRVEFAPGPFALALDEALLDAGVDIWLDTLVCLPILEGDRVAGVEVENKSGRGALRAGVVIDATGDADLAHRAGAACEDGTNWLSFWALEASLDAARAAVERGNAAPLLSRVVLGAYNNGDHRPEGSREYVGCSGRDVSEFLLESRKLLLARHKAAHAADPDNGRNNLWTVMLPGMPQFRTTRRIVGRTELADDDWGRRFDDSVGLVADWRKPGFVWEVPYSSLLPQRIRGLLAAGRCMASGGDAWEVMRVIPAAALTGQAAGLAATLSIRRRVLPDELDSAEIQAALDQKGIPYHLEQVGLSSRG